MSNRTSRIMIVGAIILLLLPLGSGITFALDPRRSLAQYSRDMWQDADGLPQNTVLCVLQTRDGYLWIGTEAGLARFDGVRFRLFDRRNTEGIRNNHIGALRATRDGSLWAGTRGGLIRYRAGKFTTYAKADGLTDDIIRSLFEDAEGTLWIGTYKGLTRFKDERFTAFGAEHGLSERTIRVVYRDREGDLWLGAKGGLHRIHDENFTTYTTADGLSHASVRAICEDAEGNLWVGTEDGLNVLKGGKFYSYTTRNGLSHNFVSFIHQDRDGNLWVGTEGGGLTRVSGGKFSTFTSRDGMSSDFVKSIYEDREGSLWVGTEGGGLNRFKDGRVVVITVKDGLSNDLVRAVREDRAGSLWVGTAGGGLNRMKDGKFIAYTTKHGLSNNFIYSIYEDAEGNLWVGTENGLNRLRDGKLSLYATKGKLPSSGIRVIYQDRAGTLWFGTGSGLSRMQGSEFVTYTTEHGLPSNFISTLYEDRHGNLWIGMRGSGLCRLKDGRFTTYATREGMPDAFVSSLLEDAEGTLWITTDNGLVRFRDGAFTLYTTREGLFSDNLHQVLEDGRGRLWMSSSNGVFHVNKEELHGLARGGRAQVTSTSYTTADGMESSVCTGDVQPAGWKTRDGRLWFPTLKGIVRIDPEDAPHNALPPPVHIEQMIVNRHPFDLNAEARLASDTEAVEFHYTGLSLLAPEKVRFKYKLQGLDKEWVDAGTRRVAYYTNLPPGDYQFRVMASNNDGVWNEAGASFAFTLQPRFYQTAWFYALCAMSIVLIGFGMHRLRVRQMRHEFSAVLAERNRIARAIHDTLLQGFAGTALHLNAIAHTLICAPEAAKRELDRVLDQVDVCLTEARRAVSELRSPTLENNGHDLVAALTKAAHGLTDGTPVALDVRVSGRCRRLPHEVERNLLRIGQEAITNTIRHAQAKRLSIELCFDDHLVRLRARDDGRGFDEHEPRDLKGEHFGLVGMRERARMIGGDLSLQSHPGAGTEVVVTVRV